MSGLLSYVYTFIAGCIATIVPYGIQQYRITRSGESEIISEHIKDIEQYSEAALIYWTSTPSEEKDAYNTVKLSTSLNRIARAYSSVSEIFGSENKEYKDLLFKLYKQSTGGDYQTKGRKIDIDRAQETVNLISELVILLRILRKDRSSLRILYSLSKNTIFAYKKSYPQINKILKKIILSTISILKSIFLKIIIVTKIIFYFFKRIFKKNQ